MTAAYSPQTNSNAKYCRPRGVESDQPIALAAIADRAVVVTVTVNGTAEVLLRVMFVGETEHVACVGAPLHVRLTEPFRPLTGVNCRL